MSTDRLSATVEPETITASLEAIEAEAEARFEAAGDLPAVRAVERDLLGKRSQLARLHTLLGSTTLGKILSHGASEITRAIGNDLEVRYGNTDRASEVTIGWRTCDWILLT